MADEPDPDAGFFSRWSRRKREAEPEDDTSEPAETAEIADDLPAADLPGDDTDLEAAAEEEDPELEANRLAAEAVDIDALTYADDFKIFLKSGVPVALRQRALRKLWRSNPILANVDGLNDYDEDFTNPAHKVYKSLWQVGKGFLNDAEIAAQKASGRISQAYETVAPDDEPEEDEVLAEEDADTEPEAIMAGEDVAIAIDAEVEPVALEDDVNDEEETAPPRRVSIRRRLEG
jgi:hypothetical protein